MSVRERLIRCALVALVRADRGWRSVQVAEVVAEGVGPVGESVGLVDGALGVCFPGERSVPERFPGRLGEFAVLAVTAPIPRDPDDLSGQGCGV